MRNMTAAGVKRRKPGRSSFATTIRRRERVTGCFFVFSGILQNRRSRPPTPPRGRLM
jgi:hypothetical protein